jgi:hypothetical protein
VARCAVVCRRALSFGKARLRRLTGGVFRTRDVCATTREIARNERSHAVARVLFAGLTLRSRTMKTAFNVLFALFLILELAITVAANVQLGPTFRYSQATDWGKAGTASLMFNPTQYAFARRGFT